MYYDLVFASYLTINPIIGFSNIYFFYSIADSIPNDNKIRSILLVSIIEGNN